MSRSKTSLAALALLSFVGVSQAQAQTSNQVSTPILFNCNMSFNIEGTSAYLGVGGTSAKGQGKLSCYDYVTGAVEDIPLKVSVKGVGLGLGVTGFNISGGKAGIGLNSRPESLLGSYARVSANAAVGTGGEVGGGLRLSFKKGALEISALMAGRSGLGAGIEVGELYIEKDDNQDVVKTPAPKAGAEKTLPSVKFPEAAAGPAVPVAQVPSENIVIRNQGDEILLVDAEGRPVKRLKVYLLQN